jgi:hypothetical protein
MPVLVTALRLRNRFMPGYARRLARTYESHRENVRWRKEAEAFEGAPVKSESGEPVSDVFLRPRRRSANGSTQSLQYRPLRGPHPGQILFDGLWLDGRHTRDSDNATNEPAN